MSESYQRLTLEEREVITMGGVDSRLVEADLNNVFVPEIKLTMDGSGKVSMVDWRWWKKVGGSWVQPTDAELASQLSEAGLEIARVDWSGDRVNSAIAFTTTGQVALPAQGFTPGAIRVYFNDTAGYHYGFEWR